MMKTGMLQPIPHRQGSAACSWRVGTLAAGRLQLVKSGERKRQRQAPRTTTPIKLGACVGYVGFGSADGGGRGGGLTIVYGPE